MRKIFCLSWRDYPLGSLITKGVFPTVLSAALLVSGFFVAPLGAGATSTGTVTVDKTFVRTGSAPYVFTVVNGGANPINYIRITAPTAPESFLLNDSFVCPTDWSMKPGGTAYVSCQVDPEIANYLAPASSVQISLSATAPAADGVYAWTVKTIDVLNGQNTQNPTTVVDNIPPSISINPPATPTKITSQTITGAFTEANIDTVAVNGIAATINGNTYAADIPLKEGSNAITVVATDKVGLSGSASSNIVLDTTPPTTMDNLSDSNWKNSNVNLILTPNDGPGGSGIAATYYATDGAVPPTILYSGPLVIDGEGQHQLVYYSVDVVGNTELAVTGHNVKIDKTKPTTSFAINPAAPNESGWYTTEPTITLSCQDQDGLSGCEGIYYRWKENEPFIKYTGAITAPEGDSTLNYYSKDNAGNEETALSFSVKTDVEKPTISNNAPGTWQKNDVTVTLMPSDSVSGVNRVLTCEGSGCAPSVAVASPYQLSHSTEGETTVRYEVTDNAGNVSTVGEYTVKIDKTPPTAGVSGAPASWTNMDQAGGVACSDTGGSNCDAGSYKLQISTAPLQSCSANPSDYLISGSATIGEHSFVCSYVKDIAGNESFSPLVTEFKVDKVLPTGSLTGIPGNWQNSNADVNLNAGDTGGSGLLGTFLNVAPYGNTCAPTTPYAGAITASQHSTACWRTTDGAGNAASGYSEIMVDKTLPASVINTPVQNSWHKENFTVNVSDSDSGGAGLGKVYYRVLATNDNWSHEEYTVGDANNWAERAAGDLLITVGSDKNCKYEGLGACKLQVKAVDNAGNDDWKAPYTAKSRTFSVDWTKPVTALSPTPAQPNGNGGWYITAPAVSLSATDAPGGSGIAKKYYKWDNADFSEYTSSLNAPEGLHTLTFYSVDAAGNEETPVTQEFKVDITKPTVSAGADVLAKAETTIAGTADDNGSGVNAAKYLWSQISGPGALTFAAPNDVSTKVSANLDGVYVVRLTAEDVAGNSDAKDMRLVWDTTAPEVTLSQDHADTIVRNGDTVLITATFNEPMTAPTVTIGSLITNAPMTNVSGNVWTYSWSVPEGNDGPAIIAVAGADLAGNEYGGADSIAFTVDNTPPTATETAPVSTPTKNNAPEVGITVENGASWEIKNGDVVLQTGTGEGAQQIVSIPTLVDGPHNLSLVAADPAGNITTTSLSPFVVDTIAPTIEVGEDVLANAPISKTASVTDDGSGVNATTYEWTQVGGPATLANSDPTGLTTNISAKTDGTEDGTYTIMFTAADTAGNSSSDMFTLTWDSTAPTASLSYSTTNLTNEDVVATLGNESEPITVTNNDGSTSHTFTTNGSFTFDFKDAAGNTNSLTATVENIDKTPPAVPTINSIAEDNYVNKSEESAVTVTGSAEADSLVQVTLTNGDVSVQGNEQLEGGATDFSITVDGSTLPDGVITPSVTATDAAGNVSEAATLPSAAKDSVIPSLLLKSPSVNAVGVVPSSNVVATSSEAIVVKTDNVSFSPALSEGFTIKNSGTNVVTITPNSALESNKKYTVTLSGVTDIAGNPLPEASWSFTTATSYSIPLTTGWNLISLPVVPSDTVASAVLGSLNDGAKIESIFKYSPTEGSWQVYHPGNYDTSSFSTMTAGDGYWVNYTDSGSGTIAGSGNLFKEGNSTPPQKSLAAGWNLIGYYQLENTTDTTAANALSTVTGQWTQLRTYSNADKTFQSVSGNDYMKPGQGYWIFMKSSSYAPYLYGPGSTDTL